MLLELLIQNRFEFILVFNSDQTIVENTKYLMTPKFDDLLLALIEILLCKIHALEDFTNISHVKYVVRFCRSWKEILS